MGIEFEINNLEEMCDTMCDNTVPQEPEQWWIFTFGCGQEHTGYYVRIHGTYRGARAKMCEKYGDEWAFQYSAVEWDKWSKDPDRMWYMEKELEVIE